jgi:predicted transcriptional regulator of viral defense system
MEFNELLSIVGDLPVFETGLLLSGDVRPADVRKQLSRWTASGKLYQLRRGLYSLASPYQKVPPHPFLIANQLQTGSYVSLQSALAYYGMIPEYTPVTTSVTTGRPATYPTPFGQFDYRHIQISWFQGYQRIDLGNEQTAFIANPEKSLLDMVYFQPNGDLENYLRSLRLQALAQVDREQLRRLALAAGKPKLLRALKIIEKIIEEESTGFEML